MNRSFSAGIFSAVAASALLASVSFATADSTSPAAKPVGGAHTQADDPQVLKIQAINGNPKAIAKIIANLENSVKDPSVPSIGNPNGDVTVLEYVDYHCGHCKVLTSSVMRLVKDDSKLRFVFIEFPIISQDSVLASRAALAVNKIDKTKYIAYHTALMKTFGTYTVDSLTKQAVALGIDEKAFKKALADKDILKTIEANRDLAFSIHIHETPAMIIGDKIIHGMPDDDDLKADIAAQRKKAEEGKKA